MKFGKRLLGEASRRWSDQYIDYKQLKHAIKVDIAAADPAGQHFNFMLREELLKVAAFYSRMEAELAAAVARLSHSSALQEVAALRAELRELNKYVALNYIAVVKATKKRNRHLKEAFGEGQVASLRAISILSQQYFYTSSKLAALSTQAEVLAAELAPQQPPVNEVLQDYQCPICLDVLRAPVLLTCAHRFCWGCLLAHCTAAQRAGSTGHKAAAGKQQAAMLAAPADSTGTAATAPATEAEAGERESEGLDEDEQHISSSCTFDCAVCRKSQLVNLDRLQVDPHLDAFLQKLQQQLRQQQAASSSSCIVPLPAAASSSTNGDSSAQAAAATEVVLDAPAAAAPCGGAPLLPPQRPEHRGRLVVCLDLDGTLVTTFTPKRAPVLPSKSVSYIVGRGGKLNPSGVFVVERPGLGEFLHRIAAFSEVVLFTAGLEEYAAPICDAIEARYPGCFHHRLYRPATTAADVYPCVKDMSRLGRDVRKCLLVDDTPLAFFHQPDHGVPVLQFRGDIDDRMLTEAVAPLLESLVGCPDVSAPLARRFNMQRWFHAQGLTPPSRPAGLAHRSPSLPQLKIQTQTSQARSGTAASPPATAAASHVPGRSLLVCEFDRTLVDWDAGERLCEELAPELTSLLSSVQMPANFIPVTNTVLAEMQRRGVSRSQLVGCLREMGREMPQASVKMLQWAARKGLDPIILSDCNTVFISQILTGAHVAPCIKYVITNESSFEATPAATASGHGHAEVATSDSAAPSAKPTGTNAGWGFLRSLSSSRLTVGTSLPPSPATPCCGGGSAGKPAEVANRLVIQPRHNHAAAGSHGCHLCPANLCKGSELAALRASPAYRHRRVVYCGDGANDLCPALGLGPGDVLLARAGHGLERLIRERAAAPEGTTRRVVATVCYWGSHEELMRLVQQYA